MSVATITQGRDKASGAATVTVTVRDMDRTRVEAITRRILFALGPRVTLVPDGYTGPLLSVDEAATTTRTS